MNQLRRGCVSAARLEVKGLSFPPHHTGASVHQTTGEQTLGDWGSLLLQVASEAATGQIIYSEIQQTFPQHHFPARGYPYHDLSNMDNDKHTLTVTRIEWHLDKRADAHPCLGETWKPVGNQFA